MQDRQLEILRAIVEEYVATEEPVGSKVIAARHQLGVSPATIRNDMAILEDQGLISQPHTSAGRIPTNTGYRLFVDRIQEVKPLSAAERRAIESFLANSDDLTDLLERTVRLLSQLTNQVALIRLPQDRVVVAGTAKLAKSIHDEVIINFLEQELILRLQKAIKLEKYEEAALLNKKTKELDVYKTEKKDIIKFIKRALEFGEYEGINVGRDKINDLYLRLRNDFSLYIP